MLKNISDHIRLPFPTIIIITSNSYSLIMTYILAQPRVNSIRTSLVIQYIPYMFSLYTELLPTRIFLMHMNTNITKHKCPYCMCDINKRIP